MEPTLLLVLRYGLFALAVESEHVAEGELRVFLPEGTWVMAAPHATPDFGSWRY